MRTYSLCVCAMLCFTQSGIAGPSNDPQAVRASLQPLPERKSAPPVEFKNSSGKSVNLNRYRGRVVLLDFWATWCTGCKKEIPWFSDFQKRYRKKGLAVVGISMDDGGWKVLKPFLSEHRVPYRILLGDDAAARQFGIQNMPDTFLIDRQGRIAAAYRAGLVDRENIQANLETLLSAH